MEDFLFDDDDCMWSDGSCIEENCEIKYTDPLYCETDDDCIWNEDDGSWDVQEDPEGWAYGV